MVMKPFLLKTSAITEKNSVEERKEEMLTRVSSGLMETARERTRTSWGLRMGTGTSERSWRTSGPPKWGKRTALQVVTRVLNPEIRKGDRSRNLEVGDGSRAGIVDEFEKGEMGYGERKRIDGRKKKKTKKKKVEDGRVDVSEFPSKQSWNKWVYERLCQFHRRHLPFLFFFF